jgi:hypothetical protein
MRNVFALICLLGLVNPLSALACDIVSKREIQVGGNEGVAGYCPNNENTVQCISGRKGENTFTCNGPEGSFDGPDLKSLIATACGCGANDEDGTPDQMNQELDD